MEGLAGWEDKDLLGLKLPKLCLVLCTGALLRQGLARQEKALSAGTDMESAAEER